MHSIATSMNKYQTLGALLLACIGAWGLSSCKNKPSMVEQRKAEICQADSLELARARTDLVIADSVATFKSFEVEDLKQQFVFEKQERYQTTGYYVLPAYQGDKSRFTFFPEVEEGGQLLLVTIDNKRKYTFTEVPLDSAIHSKLFPKNLTDSQRRDVEKCYQLAKAMQDLDDAQKQQEKLKLKIRFYEKKSARMSENSRSSSESRQ